MRTLPTLWIALAMLAAALSVGVGSAPAWASDAARAEDLIRKANDLRRRGQDAEAFPMYQEAYRIAHSPRTAAQLGLVEYSLSYWVEADRHLSEALGTANNPWVDKNRKVLEEAVSAVRAHMGTLFIDGSPAQAEVKVNDARVGNFPLAAPIRVAEGQVTIDVQAPGYQGQSRTVTVPAQGSQRVSFHLASTSEAGNGVAKKRPVDGKLRAPASSPSSSEGSPRWRTALPWWFAAAAGVATGLGVWQHIAWQHDVGAFDEISVCATADAKRGADSRCQERYDRYTSERTRAFVAYGFAGAFAVTSAVLLLTNAPASSENASPSGLVPGPGTVGLGWRGTF
jgi:hypothetical protein